MRGMNVVFVEPFFPANQRQFARALAEAGATVIGIGESPAETLDDQLKGWLHHYEQVPSVTDVESMTRAVRQVQDKVWVDRIEATVEAHTLATAQVREACTIPGTSVRTAWLCRDKPSMKQALREAGVPTAASTAASTAGEVHAFAQAVGFPLILKPRTGAGALDTVRVDSPAELDAALGAWDLYSAGNDIDLYREWANAIVHGWVGGSPSRRYASGIVALRPDHDGQITGYYGVQEAQARYGEWVLDAHLPPPGTPTQPVAAGYHANAYVRARHPDYDALRGILDDIGRTVHVYAS